MDGSEYMKDKLYKKFGWSQDKKLEDFQVIASDLRSDYQNTRAEETIEYLIDKNIRAKEAIEYLIERCKIAERKVKKLEGN